MRKGIVQDRAESEVSERRHGNGNRTEGLRMLRRKILVAESDVDVRLRIAGDGRKHVSVPTHDPMARKTLAKFRESDGRRSGGVSH